ncbi:lytic transglycosylase domain-containing protein [Sphingobium subterraneum]|uniref:Soluble lytic murein transglycosylase-like protein n=1 Tax=Sphingobium subterraneum TaxID=627688 RepID=A0A841J2I9_9SPHN|nr:lytic transglycosylase domain-containing protein [Sphingobium subterraneum]MBB6125399.1 soluble lytic murein transglycosylase-like protein [Sphingobium subterraneum]
MALALIAIAVPATAHARTDPSAQWMPLIAEASARFGVPADWIVRVMRAESGGRTWLNGQPIRSRAGAIGLMQLMPATWAAMRDKYFLGSNPDDPHDNIIAGAAYLRLMADRFGYPGLLAAYNAGPARYADYLAGKSRLPGETIAYISGITGKTQTAALAIASTPRELLFALRRDLGELPQSPSFPVSRDTLFAIRRPGL